MQYPLNKTHDKHNGDAYDHRYRKWFLYDVRDRELLQFVFKTVGCLKQHTWD